MSVNGITASSPATTSSTGNTGSVGPGGRLDKHAFLMLLVAQLKNQDPLNPMQDREFIAQLAQLNALEQLQQLNETVAAMAQHAALGQVASYLGKVVSGLERSSRELVSGTVVRATILDGTAVLELDSGQRVAVQDVVSVAMPKEGNDTRAGDSSSGRTGDGGADTPTLPGEA
ncbi:flagellar hook capping protein [Thermomicrobium sp. 4228-Ro]|uniref:flagellar hook capping FlgD N-terminal domain-containing protein n=1 Tax=Thermomicrobium sp. 4228-Ro TaxID=2993937 RepID=UPI002248EBEE|nr:flagellar hook capping FlgD N-terminal domain-containing protein [Thermomicrobium sp. 4228-Ro]MCX2727799.1 flagellar hook capping protein [Thermomicrobium sp. 4228-Ro]